VATRVDVPVVGDDEEGPPLGVVRRAGAHRRQQPAEPFVGAQHGGLVRLPAAEEVGGLVGCAEVDERGLHVVTGEDPSRLLGDPLVALLPGRRGVGRGGDVRGPGGGAEERAAVAHLHQRPPAGRDERTAAVLFGEPGREVREDVQPVAAEVVAPHAVLRGAHTGHDGRPARARHGRRAVVHLDGREETGGRERVEVRGAQAAQHVEADAVDADDEDAVDGGGHEGVLSVRRSRGVRGRARAGVQAERLRSSGPTAWANGSPWA
jgi:hypothetical protein